MRRVIAEITWLVRLLGDLSTPLALSILVHSDSQAAIHIATNPVFHKRTKHVELDCHFMRQQFVSGLITLSFIPSKYQLVDIFMKPLSGDSHHFLLKKLGVSSPPSNLRRDINTEPAYVKQRLANDREEATKRELQISDKRNTFLIKDKEMK